MLSRLWSKKKLLPLSAKRSPLKIKKLITEINSPDPGKLERERHQVKLKNKIRIRRFLLGKPIKVPRKADINMGGQYITLELEPSDPRMNPKRESHSLFWNILFLIVMLALTILLFAIFKK